MFYPRLLLTTLAVSLSGAVQMATQTTLVNSADLVFQRFINQSFARHYGPSASNTIVFWTLFTSGIFLICGFTTVIAPPLADRYGRRIVLLVNACLVLALLLISLVCTYTYQVELLLICRILLGIFVQLTVVIQPVLVTECSPVKVRGSYNSILSFAFQVGNVFGLMLGNPDILGTDQLWHYTFVTQAGLSLFSCIVLFMCCRETPHYLLRNGHRDKAIQSICYYHNCAELKALTVLDDVQAEIRLQNKNVASWRQVFVDSKLRFGTLIGALVSFVGAFSGLSAFNLYCVSLLVQTGFSQSESVNLSIGTALVGLFGNILATLVIERFGRRLLLLVSVLVCTVSDVIMMVLLLLSEQNRDQLVFGYLFFVVTCVFYFGFCVGLGPLIGFYSSELVPQAARAKAQMIAAFVLQLGLFITPFIFEPLETAVGAYSFLLFVIPCLLSVPLLYFYAPETQGKTVAQISEDIN